MFESKASSTSAQYSLPFVTEIVSLLSRTSVENIWTGKKNTAYKYSQIEYPETRGKYQGAVAVINR